jgi:hypothetical protein
VRGQERRGVGVARGGEEGWRREKGRERWRGGKWERWQGRGSDKAGGGEGGGMEGSERGMLDVKCGERKRRIEERPRRDRRGRRGEAGEAGRSTVGQERAT